MIGFTIASTSISFGVCVYEIVTTQPDKILTPFWGFGIGVAGAVLFFDSVSTYRKRQMRKKVFEAPSKINFVPSTNKESK